MRMKGMCIAGVLIGALLMAPIGFAAAQFLKLTATGTGTVNAAMAVTSQTRLCGVLASFDNTGTIPGGAYFKVRLDSVDGASYDAELYRETDTDGSHSCLWLPQQPIPMKTGDGIQVTFPNTGSLTGGTWAVQGFFSAD